MPVLYMLRESTGFVDIFLPTQVWLWASFGVNVAGSTALLWSLMRWRTKVDRR